MRIGTIVRGKIKTNVHNIKYYMPGSSNHDSLLGHKLGMFAATNDTIELWEPSNVYGMVVKIDEDISGYGPKFALVLLERKTIWFQMEDLEPVSPPNKQQNNQQVKSLHEPNKKR